MHYVVMEVILCGSSKRMRWIRDGTQVLFKLNFAASRYYSQLMIVLIVPTGSWFRSACKASWCCPIKHLKKQKALSGVSLGNTQSLSPHLLYLMFCSLMLVSPTESFTLYSEIYTVKHIYVYSGASHLSCLLIVLFELLQVFSGQKQDFFLSVITLSRECPSLFIHLPLLLNF